MTYLTDNDLKTHTLERLLNESISDYTAAKDEAEKQRISEAKSMLAKYYDVAKIFDEAQPIKHPHLTKILTKLVTYDLIRRNAARKVPTDYKEEMEWAEKELEKMNRGILKFEDLPSKPTDATNPNNSNAKILYGSLKNKNFYI